jgi:hypothetical protein
MPTLFKAAALRGPITLPIFALLLATSAQCKAQSSVTPPAAIRDATGSLAQAASINLLEAHIKSLEKKLADVEQKLAAQHAKQVQQASELEALKFLPAAFKNHMHEVVIYSIDYSQATVKDVNGVNKTVVVPGPSWGNPKGNTGAPKPAPGGAPF